MARLQPMPNFQTLLLSLSAGLLAALVVVHLVEHSQIRDVVARTGALQNFMSKRYVSVGAYEDKIEYHGRWVSTPDQSGRDASFGGSSFGFSVYNTSSVILELANAAITDRIDGSRNDDQRFLVLTPAKAVPRRAGPVSFFRTVNGSLDATYYQDVDYVIPLAINLDREATHTLRVTLPYDSKSSTFQFRGLWVDKGGQLSRLRALEDHFGLETAEQNKSRITNLLEQEDNSIKRSLVEIMAPAPLLSHACPSMNSTHDFASWAANWPTLLQDHFLSSVFSTVPISPKSCLTSRCSDTTKPQTTFLRSGPPNSTLYRHPWTFASKLFTPRALLLSLGLSDVESFLSAPSHGKHDLTSFSDDLSHKYSIFIQMLRRTVYSPSSLATTHDRLNQASIDESHLYNSAPSTLPVFLILPPIPSPLLLKHSRHIKTLLHYAATKTLNDLKWHIGDQRTIIIDTAGWLNDSDFTPCQTTTHDEGQIGASDFILTQSGHIKFAHHLSLHLCPYLRNKEAECPFTKHGEYVGNLVVPEAEGVGKVMEQKRVQKIMDKFGIK